VRGLAGAQFALPAAVEQLRAGGAADASDAEPTPLVLAASDPANVWSLRVSDEPGTPPDSFARPRGARALLVLLSGRVVMTSDASARAVAVRSGVSPEVVEASARALVRHVAARRPRDVIVETINGGGAAGSPHAMAFMAAGLRITTAGLRYYATFERG